MSYPNWVFSMFAFIGFLISMIPLPWHLEAWNTGTCLFMIWTGLACLNQFINSIVWTGNAINWAPVWCDISTRFMIGSAVAIPAASLCINRRLYYIATANAVTVTKAEKRRAIMVDLAIGVGLPVLEMVLEYIDQGHRFNIYENIGCYPFTYNTWVAYVVVVTWPLAIGCVSAVYCILSIRAFNKRRAQFKELLSANSNLNSNRYFRLMCLAATEIICTIPLSCWSIFLNVTSETIEPYNGWVNVHSDFSAVDQFPSVIWEANSGIAISLETSRWFVVMCAIIFFAYFGFADEARKNYRAAIGSVAKRVGLSTSGGSFGSTLWSSTGSKSSNGQNGLPVFVQRKSSRQRDSMDSFTDVSGIGTSFKEKSFGGDISYGAMSLADVGGALSDMEASPTDTLAPTLPTLPSRAVTREDDEFHIEISSVRHMSGISMLSPESESSAGAAVAGIKTPEQAHRDSGDIV
jgi:pheromone a factor receptor